MNKKPSLHIPILIWFIVLLFVGGITLWSIRDLRDLPNGPVAKGGFPDKPIWMFAAQRLEKVTANPIISDNYIVILTTNTVYTLNYSDGKILWKADSKRYLGYQKTSQIYHDFLVVPEENRYLVTYSLKKGQLLWRELPSKNNSDYSTHIESISSGDDKVFVARYNSTLTAYNITNGNIMWKVNAPDRSFLYTIFDQGIVYLSGNQNLTAFDAITGDQLWRLAFEELVGPIVIDHNTLYIALATGGVTIEAFSLNNHGFLWKKEFLNFDLYDTRFLVSENDILYLPNQALVALSGTDGKFLWETLKTGRLGKPVFIDGKIIVRNYNSDLFEFDAETGKQLGSLMIQTNSFADLYSLHASDRGPAVSNELLIIPFGDNRVYAYKP